MANQKHVLEFSPNGKFFAVINNNGQLLIWDTETSELKQTYSISTNTNANCTALTWIQSVNPSPSKKKNKRRSSNASETNLFIAIGTSKGKIVLYSYAKGEVEYTLKGNGHTGAIGSIFYDNTDSLYTSGYDFNIIKWSVSGCNQISSMKIGNEIPSSLLLYPESQRVLTAGRQIKLWDCETNELIQTYTGHTSNILLLRTFNVNGTDFALSGSNADRFLSMWCLNPEQKQTNSVATFSMEDVAICMSAVILENILRIVAVTRSGVIHYYVEDFGKLKVTKPIKPNVTLEIVSDRSTTTVEKIPSLAANIDRSHDSILFCYGDKQFLRFESIVPSILKRIQIEIRADPRKIKKQKEKMDTNTGTLLPLVDHEQVEYHNQGSFNRKTRINELPMETRLENLKFVSEKSGKNMAQLLIQALHSKEASMLRTVFQCTEENTIQLTLERLPPQYIAPLVDELCILMRKKTTNIQIAVTWLKYLLQTHASQLMALGTTELFDRFGPCIGIIETRINNLQTLSRLRGRLDLLTKQINNKKNDDNGLQNSNLLVYEDEDSSKETSDIEVHDTTSSDDQWEETDEDNEQNSMDVDQNDPVDESDDDDDE